MCVSEYDFFFAAVHSSKHFFIYFIEYSTVHYTMLCRRLHRAFFTALVSIAIVVTLHLSLHMYAAHIHILLVLCLLRIHRHVFKVTYLAIVHHIY